MKVYLLIGIIWAIICFIGFISLEKMPGYKCKDVEKTPKIVGILLGCFANIFAWPICIIVNLIKIINICRHLKKQI